MDEQSGESEEEEVMGEGIVALLAYKGAVLLRFSREAGESGTEQAGVDREVQQGPAEEDGHC